MSCHEAAELIGPYIDGDASQEITVRLERHLLTCATCAHDVQSQRITRERLREGIGEVTASDAFRSRALARLRADNPHLSPVRHFASQVTDSEPAIETSTQYQLPIHL